MSEQYISNSVNETQDLGARIARTGKVGDVFALVGDMGCGKTEFSRGFVHEICGPSAVRSPTFSIVNVYESGRIPVYHFDFYRLKKQEELLEIGYYEYIRGDGIVLIEWADLFPDALPENTQWIRFSDKGKNKREIIL